MNSDASIRAFIAATRGTDAPTPALTKFYTDLFGRMRNRLSDAMHPECLPPLRLHVSYSPEAKAETIYVGNDAVLIYDQYLGQVFSQLNRLSVREVRFEYTAAYLYKLCANMCLLNGQPAEALDYALLHRRHKPTSTMLNFREPAASGMLSERSASPHLPHPYTEENRSFYTSLQEAFVVAHELAHHLHAKKTVAAIVSRRLFEADFRIGETYFEIEQGAYSDALSPSRVKRLQADWVRLYRRVHGRNPDSAMIASTSLAWQNMKPPEQRDLRTELLDPVLREECVCDQLAAGAVAELAVQWGSDYQTGIVASFMALHWMRLLRILRAVAPRIAEDMANRQAVRLTTDDFRSEQVRLDVFRRSAAGTYGRHLLGASGFLAEAPGILEADTQGSEDLDLHQALYYLHKGTSEFNWLYFERIGDFMEEYFLPVAASELTEVREDPNHVPLAALNPFQAAEVTRILCGFSPVTAQR